MKIKADFLYLFFLIPTFKNYFVLQNQVLDNIFDYWGVISCLLLLTYLLITKINNANKYKIDKCTCLLFLLFINYIITTVWLEPSEILGAISEFSRALITPLFIVIEKNKSRFDCRITTLAWIYYWYLLFDCFSILTGIGSSVYVEANGSTDAYSFVGLDNYAIYAVIPMMTIVFFVLGKKRNNIAACWLLYVLCLICKIYTKSFMSSVALASFGIVVFIYKYLPLIKKIVSAKFVFACSAIIVLSVCLFHIQDYFATILAFFGKDTNMGYRILFWPRTFSAMAGHWVIGHGHYISSDYITAIGLNPLWDSRGSHPHNYALEILYRCGIVGCFAFGYIFFNSIRRVMKYCDARARKYYMAGMVAFVFAGIADGYILIPFIYGLMFLGNSQKRRCIS